MAVNSGFLYISLKCEYDGIYPATQYCFASLKIKIHHCESGLRAAQDVA